MKKLFLLSMVLLLVVGFAGFAMATPKYAGVQPVGDAQGNVTIPSLPNGQLLNVWVWNDCNGSKPKQLGAVSTFKLGDPTCDSFNFLWKDSEGTWWQMVTPATKPGGKLKAVYHPEGYKYGLKSADVNK